MTWIQAVTTVRARWRLVLGVGLAMLLLATAAGVLRAPKYTASASVLVDFRPDPSTVQAFGGLSAAAHLATQAEIVRSERVALGVVVQLALLQDAELAAQWRASGSQVSQQRWLVDWLRERLDVVPAREGSLIEVRFTDTDRERAAARANAFVQVALQVARQLRVDPALQHNRFADERLQSARSGLERAQAKLSAFQSRHGIVTADERLDIETARLSELSSQYTTVQALAQESASRQRQASGHGAERLPEVMNHPLLAQMKAELARAENNLQQLGARLGDRHPQVLDARALVAEQRQRLQAETRQVMGSIGVADSINSQRVEAAASALAAQRSRVLQLKGVRDEGALLQRELDHAQRAYDSLLQRATQTALDSQSPQGPLSQLAPALPPAQPTGAGPLLHALLGALLGAMAGVAAALLLELRDRRVRVAADVEQLLGLPLLGRVGAMATGPSGAAPARLALSHPGA